jgi:dynactin-5
MKIGDFVHIGTNSVVEAASIGNYVEIGKNCVIVRPTSMTLSIGATKHPTQGKFAIIKDCAKMADNTILMPNAGIPAQTLFAGSPGMYGI